MPLINSYFDTKPKTNDLFISQLSNIPANLTINRHTNRRPVTYITTKVVKVLLSLPSDIFHKTLTSQVKQIITITCEEAAHKI